MDSVQYSALLVQVGQRMMRIAHGAEAAADGDLDGDDRAAAIALARAKLSEYDAAYAAVAASSSVLAAQFAKHFTFHVELLRDSLAQIDTAA
jgi:hypothetical protein